MQFDPSMVEAKPAADKDLEDQDMPSAEAVPLEPADSAMQVPKPPAAGEVNTVPIMSFAVLQNREGISDMTARICMAQKRAQWQIWLRNACSSHCANECPHKQYKSRQFCFRSGNLVMHLRCPTAVIAYSTLLLVHLFLHREARSAASRLEVCAGSGGDGSAEVEAPGGCSVAPLQGADDCAEGPCSRQAEGGGC